MFEELGLNMTTAFNIFIAKLSAKAAYLLKLQHRLIRFLMKLI